MKIIDFSIKRRVTVTMIITSMVVFGLVSFNKLPINLLPDISYPSLTIRTEFPGVAPGEIENLVSLRVEESVGVVNGVQRVSSVSRTGRSDVIVEFNWGTNMDFASLDVREKLDMLNLPLDADKPILLRFDPSLDPILRLGIFGDMDLLSLRVYAEEELKRELESLEGVAAARVNGGLEEEIHVEIKEGKLASIGIPISQVTSRLGQENIDLTGGTLKDGDAEFLVRTLNQFKTIEEINDIVIGFKGNAPIKISDIGRAYRSHKERTIITRINGKESLEIAIYKESGTNTVAVAQSVKDRLDEVLKTRLSGLTGSLNVEIITDQSRFIKESISEVLSTAVIGGILAILILYFFLRNVQSTGIIGLAIPVSVIATFFMMFLSGISLNIMSLGGLALGVGMLVDNSIVVLESISRFREKGMSQKDASFKGASIVGKAVIASTLTTICVFFPIIFVHGIAGQLFSHLALAVTFSLIASLVVAMTFIPMVSSIEMKPLKELNGSKEKPKGLMRIISFIFIGIPTYILIGIKYLFKYTGKLILFVLSPFFKVFDMVFNWIIEIYPSMLRWALYHKFIMILIAFVLLGSAVYSVRFVGSEFLPDVSQGEFQINFSKIAGTPVEETDRVLNNIMSGKQDWEPVQTVYNISGMSNQAGGSTNEERENIGQVSILLKESTKREVESAVMNSLREEFAKIPGIKYKFSRPALFSFATPIEVEIKGYNIKMLDQISNRLAQRMGAIDGLTDVKSSMEGGNPEIHVIFDRKKLASLGFTISQIAGIIKNKIQGDIASEFLKRNRRIDIRVRSEEEDRQSIEDIKRITINQGGEIPIQLASVAELQEKQGPSEIRRIDQERVALVTANIQGRDLGYVTQEIQKVIDNMEMPADFYVSIGGQSKEMDTAFQSLLLAIALAVFLVYLVMASQFESLLHPLVIMFTIPFGLVGVVISLLITGKALSVIVGIGVIMLAGIVVNGAIVLVDYINYLRREQNMPKYEAIIEAGKARLRPIIITTATTVLGLIPMAIGLGEGSELRAPMAIVVVGGLLTATFLTLLLLPTVYAMVDRGK